MPIEAVIPSVGHFQFEHLLLDQNGTLSYGSDLLNARLLIARV